MNAFNEYLMTKTQRNMSVPNCGKLPWSYRLDNLRVSNFLIETARKHIEREISMDEVNQLIDEHYAQRHKYPRND